MFIDEVTIWLLAGKGGDGCCAFRREKYIPRGGPAGGDGGKGGDLILRSDTNHNTLLHFRFSPEHKATPGRPGEGSNCSGKSSDDMILPVPPGTVVYNAESGERLYDFSEPGQEYIAAHGGRGGRGNARFATSTDQAPRRADPGEAGENVRVRLELKLLADVGLVGYPNAGKSTLISFLSASRPKIADYPFTTLEPNLGVVRGEDDETFVMADIPGIIEGAHEGHGLGIKFLRHIERTGLLLHMIDVSEFSDRDPVDDYRVIMGELSGHSDEMLDKQMIVVANKIDSCQDPERIERLETFCREEKVPFAKISAATGQGVDDLRRTLARMIRDQKRADAEEGETIES